MNKLSTFLKSNETMIRQFIKYSIAGAISFASDYLAFLFVIQFAHYQIATYSGMIIGLIVSYVISKLWVFNQNKEKNDLKVAGLFVIVTIIGFALSGFGMYIGVELIKIDEKIMKLIVSVLVFLFNFILKKYFVWRA